MTTVNPMAGWLKFLQQHNEEAAKAAKCRYFLELFSSFDTDCEDKVTEQIDGKSYCERHAAYIKQDKRVKETV